MLLADLSSSPILRDILLLLISFVMILGTLFIYFRLRTGTFRRTRKLLEERVEVKTQQLTEKNIELEKLSLVASKTDNSVIIADATGEIEWVNDSFSRLTGLTKDVIGKKISDISVYKNIDEEISKAITRKHSRIFESHLSTPENESVWISSTLTPIVDENNEIKKIVLVDTDISKAKKLEGQITSSLREKEVLLKEIHHRVKNNLQIIISLLNLQSGYIKDEQTLRAVRDSQNRVRSMALVHEKFYQENTLSEIDFGEYAAKLCRFLEQSYGDNTNRITFDIVCDKVNLEMDTAMPCGMLITEIISNSFKYAFPDNREGVISFRLKKLEDNKIKITVSDNGIGLPDDFQMEGTESLGMQLILAFAQQIDGEIELAGKGGTNISITFTYPKS
jgi:PAS domain S-box-containing protein